MFDSVLNKPLTVVSLQGMLQKCVRIKISSIWQLDMKIISHFNKFIESKVLILQKYTKVDNKYDTKFSWVIHTKLN